MQTRTDAELLEPSTDRVRSTDPNSECDCCRWRHVKVTPVAQGPLTLQLCARCASDPFFDDRGLLRSFDHLQHIIQLAVLVYLREQGQTVSDAESFQTAQRLAWTIAESEYPRAAIGIGSCRITLAFGRRLAAKISWHGRARSDTTSPHELSKVRADVESNVRQAATWLAVRDQEARYLLPCHVLTEAGVLWAPRVDPLGPANNLNQVRDIAGMWQLGTQQQALLRCHGTDLAEAWRALRARPFTTKGVRLNNWGYFQRRLVHIDEIGGPPPGDPDFRANLDAAIERLHSRNGDVPLNRRMTRRLVIA